MRHKKFAICLTSILSILLYTNAFSGPIQVYTLTTNDISYNADGLITSCSYDFSITNIIIPGVLNKNDTIKGVADGVFGGVFENKGITAIALPSTFKKIGTRAFKNNSLSFISTTGLTSLIYIGENAFAGNNFFNLTLPANTSDNFLGWRNSDGNEYDGGTITSNLSASYKAILAHILTDDEVEVNINGFIESCSYNFSNTDIIIPDTLDNQKVGVIQANIFEEKNITSVLLPNSLRIIGVSAFRGNNISRINLSNLENLTRIHDGAFNNNNIVSVNFANCTNLNYIGSGCFAFNELSTIDLSPCTNLEEIGSFVFSNNSISSFNLPTHSNPYCLGWYNSDSVKYNSGSVVTNLGQKYTAILPYTLTDSDVLVHPGGVIGSCNYDYSNSYILIPDTLDNLRIERIGWHAFYEHNITNIALPRYLRIIDDGAFENCKIKAVDFSQCPNIVSIGNEAFRNNNISDINFNQCSSLETINDYAFIRNSIPSIDLSPCTSLKKIGYCAFYLNQFENFTLPTNSNNNYAGWLEYFGTYYPMGSTVNTNTEYDLVLKHSLDFIIRNETAFVEDAYIRITGGGLVTSQSTNEDGWCGWLTHDNTYTINIYKEGYYDYNSTIILNTDTTIHITIEESPLPPESRTINNRRFNNSDYNCFGATQTIVVADDGESVVFQSGSNTNLIAGQSIRILPGTKISPGAYLHAYITSTGEFCESIAHESIVSNNNEKIKAQQIKPNNRNDNNLSETPSLSVFPNPNNGQFTIVANGFDDNTKFIIYNPMGKTILKDILRKENALDLSSYNKGLYFIKTISNNKVLTQKILIR